MTIPGLLASYPGAGVPSAAQRRRNACQSPSITYYFHFHPSGRGRGRQNLFRSEQTALGSVQMQNQQPSIFSLLTPSPQRSQPRYCPDLLKLLPWAHPALRGVPTG